MPVLLLTTIRRPGHTRSEAEVDFVDPSHMMLDALIKKHGGHVVRSQGESTLSVFGPPEKALACALALQSRCAKDNRGRKENERIYMRMTLHMTASRDGDQQVSDDESKVASLISEVTPFGRVFLSRQVYEASSAAPSCFIALALEYFSGMTEPIEIFEAVPQTAAR